MRSPIAWRVALSPAPRQSAIRSISSLALGKSGASPEGVSNWGQLTPDFLEGNSAIIQHTTGNLTNIRANAKFPFGIVGLPGKEGPRTVVGGGNIYFFKNANPAERKAALAFARFLAEPDRAADWSMRTGYIGTRPEAYETKTLKDYIAGFPAADVARGYLPVITHSAHYIADPGLRRAIADYLVRERAYVEAAGEELAALAPFRKDLAEQEQD